jgi:flagellar biosynthesis protein FliQ
MPDMTTQYVLGLGRDAVMLTLSFIPKIVAVALALVFVLPWIVNKLVTYTTGLFNSISMFSS